MCSPSFVSSRVEPGLSTSSRGRKSPKSSVYKRLKKLVGSSQSTPSPSHSHASSSESEESQRRRKEALKSCGLLKQSVKYGGPYRDGDEEDAKTIVSSNKHLGEDAEKMKDLLMFDDEVKNLNTEQDDAFDPEDEKMMPLQSPTSPSTRRSIRNASDNTCSDSASTVDSDSSTLVPRHPPIRMRRIGSLTEEIDQIEDDETRRLTEVAFLS